LNTRDPITISQPSANDAAADVEISTIGLPDELLDLSRWAANVWVEQPLFLVLDATGCATRDFYTGTVLTYLTQSTIRTRIRDWQNELSFLPPLGDLIDACLAHPFIFARHRPMSATHSVTKLMKDGAVRNYPLVALIMRPVQDVSADDKPWIEALRDWCFIQFLSAIYSKTEPTQYLIDVASKLRLGIDKDTDWLDTFVRLKGSTSSFTELTRHLGASAKNLLEDTKHPIDLPSHRKLLETLHNFCQGKSPKSEANPTTSAGGGLFKRYLELPALQRRPPELSPSSLPRHETHDNLDAQDLGIECFDADDFDEEVNQVAGVNENDTPASQEIKVKQVLLSSVEDYQFLPFSWNRPNAYERHALNQWLEQAWTGQDLGTLKIATLLFAAIQTGNSLRTVLTSRITKDSSDDWSVDIDESCLHRRPPRRYAGWRSTQETDAWVSPRAEQLRIALPSAATAVLAQLHRKAPGATNLLELWFAEPSPEQQFRSICRSIPALHRVTSGMLAYWLEQNSFEISADPVLSHLLASRPISGLPGSCAYSSYTLATVRSAIRVVAAPATPTSDAQDLLQADHNAAGSELCPIESLIGEACADALASVDRLAIDSQRWPFHHNSLTAYCILVLLAATGGRPVTSPFESIRYVDLKALHIYIEDKVSSGLTQGRLLPLPEFAATLIEQHYLPHLSRLAQLIGASDPAMSKEVALLASGQPSAKLPLFFLLEINPRLAWLEVSEKTLSGLNLFKWPLPWNLMRHRFPTQLKRMGANHEIVSGLTGHVEQGTASYGYYSTRVWQDDALETRALLDDLLGRLGLEFPKKPNWPIDQGAALAPSTTGSAISDDDIFGLEARREKRKQSHDSTVLQATAEIVAFVADRPLDSLSPEEWETLSRTMLLNAASRTDQSRVLPHHHGSLRYDTLRHWITENWLEKGTKPRIKKRYLPLLEEASPFTPDSIGAISRCSRVLALLHTSLAFPLARAPSKRDALCMGIVLLMAESRLADMKVLNDLLKGQHFRVQGFKDAYFLEHAPSLDRYPLSPVRRYKISEMTAALLATARSSHYKLNVAEHPLPTQLLCLRDTFGVNPGNAMSTLEFVRLLAITVNQANAKQFPGFVAAYLNGQIVTVGLGHSDWVRVQLGHAVQLPETPAPVPDKKDGDESATELEAPDLAEPNDATYEFMARELVGTAEANPSKAVSGGQTATSDTPAFELTAAKEKRDSDESATELEAPDLAGPNGATYESMACKLVGAAEANPSRAVSEEQIATSDTQTVKLTAAKEKRAKLAPITGPAQTQSHLFFQALRDELSAYGKEKSSPRRDLDNALRRLIRENPTVSRSCRLLGEWIRSLIWRKHHSKLIAISSLGRYLNALSVCFEAVASEHDLLNCDGDEVTAFYQDVMEARWAIRPNSPSADQKPSAEQVRTEQAPQTDEAIATDENPQTYKTRRLALQLLRDFHRLMSRTIAIEDPDWSEIDAGDDVLSISPGLLLEKEYQHALLLAAPKPETASREELARAFILLVGMRFGLRGAEITGLLRTDWGDTVPGTIIVLVQKNRYRDLKTPAARRQVPLLFELSDNEKLVVKRFLALWEGIARNDNSIPLFVSPTDNSKLMNDKFLRWQVSQFIKQATLNSDLSLHHARHTFANRVGLILMQGTGNIWPHAVSAAVSQAHRSHVRKLLLCTEAVTRRSLWALARLMGHAHPQTTVRSYLHFLPELTDQYVWNHQAGLKKNWPTPFEVSLRLHELQPAPNYLSAINAETAPSRLPAPSPQACLRFLYLYQHGATVERASFSSAIEYSDAQILVEIIKHVDETLARRPHINPHKAGVSNLLSHIRPERWSRLIAWAGSAVAPPFQQLTSRAHLESALKMIGPSRQILLYRQLHFDLLRQITTIWGLQNSDLRLVSPQTPHPMLEKWAPRDLEIEVVGSDKKSTKLQIDAVEDVYLPMLPKHRCAVLPIVSGETLIHDSFEWVALVVVSLFLMTSPHSVSRSRFGSSALIEAN
jgi:integrase